MIYLAIFLLTIISLKDLPMMIKSKLTKELVFFSLLTLMNLTYAVLILLDLEPYSPQDIILWMGNKFFSSPQ